MNQRIFVGFGSRGQISDRIEDGLVEFVQSSPLQSPVEYLAHISAVPAEVDIVLPVRHRVLDRREPTVRLRGGAMTGDRTRIIVRRVQAEPRAIWAGGIPQASFAMVKTWINTSKV